MYECLNCHKPVTTITVPGVGTVWTHEDGFQECRPRYASPNFDYPIIEGVATYRPRVSP